MRSSFACLCRQTWSSPPSATEAVLRVAVWAWGGRSCASRCAPAWVCNCIRSDFVCVAATGVAELPPPSGDEQFSEHLERAHAYIGPPHHTVARAYAQAGNAPKTQRTGARADRSAAQQPLLWRHGAVTAGRAAKRPMAAHQCAAAAAAAALAGPADGTCDARRRSASRMPAAA